MGEFKVAIQLDPKLSQPYANLARLFFRHVKPPELEQEYQHICEEFGQSAPQVLSRLSLEMVELGKEQVYEGFYTKGHRIKNLMGIIGSRLRGLGRKAEESQRGELNRLGGEYEALYDEWVGFLEAMKTDKIHPAIIDLGRLVRRVAAGFDRQTWKAAIQTRIQEGLPRVEADERMLREAMEKGFDNALVADALGNVAETATSNVFMAKNGEVYTPVANGTFLAGITRSRIMGLLQDAGYSVHEAVLSFDDVRAADEVFLTGNMAKVVSVSRFDDIHYQRGPVATEALELYWSWAANAK